MRDEIGCEFAGHEEFVVFLSDEEKTVPRQFCENYAHHFAEIFSSYVLLESANENNFQSANYFFLTKVKSLSDVDFVHT